MRFFAGLILGLLLLPIAVFFYLRFGQPSVAVGDAALPFEKEITHVPLNARIDRERVKTPPIAADQAAFIAGSQIYRQNCAACHGIVDKNSAFARNMMPRATQLFVKHREEAVVGVSDDPAGETYWKVANGIRLSGMPAYKSILSDTEMWQVSLLLANADKLPPDVMDSLKQPLPQP